MSTKHGSLSSQAVRRLQGGELILKDFDNDEIVDILDVEHLEEKTFESAQRINNDPKLLASFFHHAKLAL